MDVFWNVMISEIWKIIHKFEFSPYETKSDESQASFNSLEEKSSVLN